MTLILTVIVIALIFEYINGFHDTANSIATVVSTKVLTPRQAVILAAFTNLFGAMWGTAVAKTITGGIVDSWAWWRRDLEHHHLHADGGDHLEPDHVVVRAAFQFQSCAHRRALRRGAGSVARQLAFHHLVATKFQTLVSRRRSAVEELRRCR